MGLLIPTIDIEHEPGNKAVEGFQVRSFKVCFERVVIAIFNVKYDSSGMEFSHLTLLTRAGRSHRAGFLGSKDIAATGHS